MAITEETRLEMHLGLRKVLGDATGDTLMEHLPPLGWANVARQDDMVARFEIVGLRFEGMDRRFADIDRRFTEIDKRFDALERRLDVLENKLNRMLSTFVMVQVGLFTAMFGVLIAK